MKLTTLILANRRLTVDSHFVECPDAIQHGGSPRGVAGKLVAAVADGRGGEEVVG